MGIITTTEGEKPMVYRKGQGPRPPYSSIEFKVFVNENATNDEIKNIVEAMKSMPEVQEVCNFSQPGGQSIVYVTLKSGCDIDKVMDNARAKKLPAVDSIEKSRAIYPMRRQNGPQ
jgi:hypothetical protein